jgi:hypothetical protein
MNILMLIGLGIVFGFIIFGFIFCVMAYRASRKKEKDSSQRKRAVVDDLGDQVLWEMGKERPIIQTKGLEVKMTQRSFLQKLALGTLVSFAGWVAARGENLVWAEKIAVSKTGKNSEKSVTLDNRPRSKQAAPSHSDGHTDSTHTDTAHNDTAHYDDPGTHIDVDHADTQPHADGSDEQGHIDQSYGSHTDVDHSDTNPYPHTDQHTDQAHTDIPHGDSTHTDAS